MNLHMLKPRFPLLVGLSIALATISPAQASDTTSPDVAANKATLFLTARTSAVGAQPFGVAAGDFNGDGKPDLAVANELSNNVSILVGKGDCGLFKPGVMYPAGSRPISVAVGDLNNDGKLDLAVSNEGNDNLSVLIGNGDGSFKSKVDYPLGSWPRGVVVGDFNGDGKVDLAVTNYMSQYVSVLMGKGDGTFQPAASYFFVSNDTSIALGDFNGDGAPDIATTADSVDVNVFLNTRGTVSTLTSSSSTSSAGDPVTFTADVNVSVLGSQTLAGRMTGTVTFRDGATILGTVPRSSRNTTLTVSSLSKGTHTITAAYSGDSNFNPVTSPLLTQSVQ